MLDALAGEGVLVYHSNTSQKSSDKTEKMLSLDMEAGEAMARISRRSPARMDVVSVLADGGWMSQKELVYMTGVTDAALRDMVKKGMLREHYEERFRTPDFSEVPKAAPPVLSAAQQEVYDGIAALMDENAPRAALLFGVTGSGKTQLYLKLIEKALARGKSAVSYTHLDVYKRQAARCARSGHRPAKPRVSARWSRSAIPRGIRLLPCIKTGYTLNQRRFR